jgi:hypothetical protein
MALPSSGKRTAASTLKKKMTDMACATSSSSAPITGAVAAMADPPQMDEPTPTSVEMLDGMRSTRWRPHAMASAVVMVHTMIGSDCAPVLTTTARSMPKPSSTTAAWSTYLDVHLMPLVRRTLAGPDERDDHAGEYREDGAAHDGDRAARQPRGYGDGQAGQYAGQDAPNALQVLVHVTPCVDCVSPRATGREDSTRGMTERKLIYDDVSITLRYGHGG